MYEIIIQIPTTQPEIMKLLGDNAIAFSMLVTLGPPGAAAVAKGALMAAPAVLEPSLGLAMKVRPLAWVLRNIEPNVLASLDAFKKVYDKTVEPEGDGTPKLDPPKAEEPKP